MKKVNRKSSILIGLVSLSIFSSCVQTNQEMNRPTLGNAKRNCNRNQKKLLIGIGGSCAGLLAVTSGALYYSYTSSVSNTTDGNTTGFTATPLYNLSATDFQNQSGVYNHTSMGTILAYNSWRPNVSTTTEVGSSAASKALPYSSSTLEAHTPTRSTATTSNITENQTENCFGFLPDINVVKCLIRNNEDLNKRYTDNKTILMIAAVERNIHVSKLLIDKKVDVNAQDSEGRTALIYAVIRCKTSDDIPKLFIDNNVDLNIEDIYKKTALTYAIEGGQKDLVELLRKKGAIEGGSVASV